MTDEELRLLSIALEQRTGYDSIPTIEAHYRTWKPRADKPDAGFGCVFPGCARRTRTATSMWLHVHFLSHGLSFNTSRPEEASAMATPARLQAPGS